jgi:hypothetical protein
MDECCEKERGGTKKETKKTSLILFIAGMRILVATLLPNGGTTATALGKLGYRVETSMTILGRLKARELFVELMEKAHKGMPFLGGPPSAQGTGRGSAARSTKRRIATREMFPPPVVTATGLDSFVAEVDVCAGAPASLVVESMVAASPPFMKVILVEHDPKHVESFCAAMEALRLRIRRDLPWIIRSRVQCFMPGCPGCPMPAPTPELIEAYADHVKDVVHPKRLLIFRPHRGDGWKELCDFLEIHQSISDAEPFPSIVGDFDGGCLDYAYLLRKVGRRAKMLQRVVVMLLFYALYLQYKKYAKRKGWE